LSLLWINPTLPSQEVGNYGEVSYLIAHTELLLKVNL
jgi:hypothetical protein